MNTSNENVRPTTKDSTGVPPVFLTCRSLPGGETPYTVREICAAAEKTSGFNSVIGAKKIGAIWRLYPKTAEQRVKLILQSVVIRGHTISPFDKNPFIVRTPEGEKEIKTTKVIVGNIPISYSNDDIEKTLTQLGCVPRSRMLMERDRDEKGQLTRWLTGRRFIYIDVPTKPLPKRIQVGPCTASVFHREQKFSDEESTCTRCFQKGHRAMACENDVVCRTCHCPGHRSGDPVCGMQAPAPSYPGTQPIIPPTSHTDLTTPQNQPMEANPSTEPDATTSPSTPTTLMSFIKTTPLPRRGRSLSQSTLDLRGRARSTSTKRRRSPTTQHPEGKSARTSTGTPSATILQQDTRKPPHAPDVTADGNPDMSLNEGNPT